MLDAWNIGPPGSLFYDLLCWACGRERWSLECMFLIFGHVQSSTSFCSEFVSSHLQSMPFAFNVLFIYYSFVVFNLQLSDHSTVHFIIIDFVPFRIFIFPMHFSAEKLRRGREAKETAFERLSADHFVVIAESGEWLLKKRKKTDFVCFEWLEC